MTAAVEPRRRIAGYAYVFVCIDRSRPVVSWRMDDPQAVECRQALPANAGGWDDEQLRRAAAAHLGLSEDDAALVELGMR